VKFNLKTAWELFTRVGAPPGSFSTRSKEIERFGENLYQASVAENFFLSGLSAIVEPRLATRARKYRKLAELHHRRFSIKDVPVMYCPLFIIPRRISALAAF